MRDFKGMKRQRGRNRKPGGGANAANPNRSWDSQGPENIKVRGNAQTVYERYMQLARDATASGDRVLAENYLQHAEHYFRVLRALQPARPVSEIAQRELSSQGFDIDFEDESGAQAAAFLAAQQAEQQRQQQDADRAAGREAQPRDAADNGDNGPRADRDRDGEGQNGRRESRRERWERRREERSRRFDAEGEGGAPEGFESSEATDTAAEPASEPAFQPEPAVEAEAPPPARRARAPRAVAADDDSGAAALPGFLTRSSRPASAPDAEAETAQDEPAAPRRRATRRKAEAPAED